MKGQMNQNKWIGILRYFRHWVKPQPYNYICSFKTTIWRHCRGNSPFKNKTLNGNEIETVKSTMINIEHKDRYALSNFWIIDKGIVDLIVGKKLCDFFKNIQDCFRRFPIERKIKMPPGKMVSITKPIKYYRDKTEFLHLI